MCDQLKKDSKIEKIFGGVLSLARHPYTIVSWRGFEIKIPVGMFPISLIGIVYQAYIFILKLLFHFILQ